MIKSRLSWLSFGLVACVSFALYWQGREDEPEKRVRTGELPSDALGLRAVASSSEEGHGAALSLDGRREGALPHAWRPARAGRSELSIEADAKLGWLGVVISWSGPGPREARLRLGAAEQVVPAPNAENESVLFFSAPAESSRLVLELDADGGNERTGVAELSLLPESTSSWLIAPRARADADLELLQTYGALGVARIPQSAVVASALSVARVVLVSDARLAPETVSELRAYVERGGVIVELGPSAGVCGGEVTGHETAEAGFVLSGRVGAGVRWFSSVARLSPCAADDAACASARVDVSARDPRSGAELPLAVTRVIGRGECTRWLGDLTAAVRDLRQGERRLSQPGVSRPRPHKPADLFVSRMASGDEDVPSADRLGFALLAQLARAEGDDVFVSPLPAGASALVVYTADQDFVPAPGVLAHSHSAADAGLTVLLTAQDLGGRPDVSYPEAREPMLGSADLTLLAGRGHGAGIHPNLVGLAPETFAQMLAQHARRFEVEYGMPPRVVRNHHVIWSGYVEMAEHQARAGLLLNLDYLSSHRSGRVPPGFMTGSGLPMRFADEHGRLLPMFQQATQLDDSSLIAASASTMPAAIDAMIASTRKLLAIARREHVALTLLHHPHWWFHTGGAYQDALLAAARDGGVPVWGATEWLRFVQARRATRLTRRENRVQVTTFSPGVTLLVETKRSPRLDGKPAVIAGSVELAGTRYEQLVVPHGTAVIEL